MKNTKKRVFGLLGLAIIAAITVFAAFLPAPNAAAADSSTVLRVRVLGDIPDVTITDGPVSVVPSSPTPIVTTSEQSFTYINEKVDHVVVTLHYEGRDGNSSDYTLDDYYVDYVAGGKTIDLNLDDYGYGTFTITVTGDGQYGYDEDTISFDYVPITIEAEQPAIDEDPIATYFYDATKTDSAVLNVYTDEGVLIPELSDIPVTIGEYSSTLPFEANNMPVGYYRVEIVTYDDNGDEIGTAIDRFYYDLSNGGPVQTDVDIEAEQPAIDEDPIATYDYDASITDHAILNVYDDDGNLITVLSEIPVTIGEYTTTLPFGENNMEEGWYRVEIITYDDQGNQLGTDIDRFYYDLSNGEPIQTDVDIEAEQPAIDEDPIATYEYDATITDHAILNVYDDDGNLITVLSEIPVTIGEYTTTLPFGENNMEEGWYRVEIITYDEQGNVLGTDIDRFFYDLSGGEPAPTKVEIEAEQPKIDDDPVATYEYDPDITDTAILNVYDDEGNLIPELSNIPVTIGEYTTTLPFADNKMKKGYYRVEIVTFDEDGNELGRDIDRFYYNLSSSKPEPKPEPKPQPKPDDDDIPDVPNTGIFTNLGISRADYVTTSLIIFFAATIVALIYTAKKGQRHYHRR